MSAFLRRVGAKHFPNSPTELGRGQISRKFTDALNGWPPIIKSIHVSIHGLKEFFVGKKPHFSVYEARILKVLART